VDSKRLQEFARGQPQTIPGKKAKDKKVVDADKRLKKAALHAAKADILHTEDVG
jgi:hypothetical protein